MMMINPTREFINVQKMEMQYNNYKMEGKGLAILLTIIGLLSVAFVGMKSRTEVSEFQAWKEKHNIKFQSAFEEKYREKIFNENLEKIKLHNMNEHRTYDEGINQFTAITQEEFAQSYLGTVVVPDNIVVDSSDDISVGDVNWVEQGAVTGVKDQKVCGSCWAFSATGTLQGLSKIGYGTLESFSEQQLVDCSGKYGNMGCNGGLTDNAFKYVRDNGIVHQSDYPYKAVQQTCHIKSGSFKISGFTDVKSCCSDLANAVTGRPVSAAVDADNWSRYSKGIFSNCKTSHLNHGVLVVGVTDKYWLVKNSWGTTWGESGYIKLARGNTCGICNAASYPNK